MFIALFRNSNALLTNIRRHRGIVQHLNNSSVNCAKSLKYFEDVKEKVDTSGMFLYFYSSYEKRKGDVWSISVARKKI